MYSLSRIKFDLFIVVRLDIFVDVVYYVSNCKIRYITNYISSFFCLFLKKKELNEKLIFENVAYLRSGCAKCDRLAISRVRN